MRIFTKFVKGLLGKTAGGQLRFNGILFMRSDLFLSRRYLVCRWNYCTQRHFRSLFIY